MCVWGGVMQGTLSTCMAWNCSGEEDGPLHSGSLALNAIWMTWRVPEPKTRCPEDLNLYLLLEERVHLAEEEEQERALEAKGPTLCIAPPFCPPGLASCPVYCWEALDTRLAWLPVASCMFP